MAKLNYSNRKSEGVKLGQIVAKDLRKRIKSSPTTSRTEPHRDNSPVELNLEGKNLTDDGLREAVEGLQDVMGVSYPVTRIQVLNLSRNGLTTQSLSTLESSLEAASYDLEELDLSGNDIRVQTELDAHHWEIFLRSLGKCQKLRKLSLTANDLSGSRSFDIFVKVYMCHFKKNEVRLKDYVQAVEDDKMDMAVSSLDVSENVRSLGIQTAAPPFYNSGLPSVHHILLSNTSITDAGALFLSYTLGQHKWIREANPEVSLLGSGTSDHCGITYLPNEGISSTGVKMLKLAENVSHNPFEAYEAPPGPENSPIGRLDSIASSQSRKSSATKRRSSSIGSTSTEQVSIKQAFHTSSSLANDDLEAYRRKMQRAILEENGVGSVELWAIAFKLMVLARNVLAEGQIPQGHSPLNDFALPATDAVGGYHRNEARRSSDTTPRPVTPWSTAQYTESNDRTYAVSGIADVLSPHTPTNPRVRRYNLAVESDFAQHGSRSTPNRLLQLHGLLAAGDTEQRMIGSMPEIAWRMVITELADPKRVLSKKQREAVMAWGEDRRTLAIEAEDRGKSTAVQMWKVLDRMGCLIYDNPA